MGDAPQFVDISVFNPANIDWLAYKNWSKQNDGISRVAMRSSYGNGYTDQHFATYRAGALAAGIDRLFIYHYGYAQYNTPQAEADWMHAVVGAVRPADMLILDFEEGVPQATAQWAYEWLSRQEQNYSGKLPAIYASDAYVRGRLQDARLARYPLWLANWQFTPTERPSCPPPWSKYEFLQYTDRATNIPGIMGTVDADIYLGGEHMPIPTNWHDDGHTLTSPNGHHVVLGFRDHILSAPAWDAGNQPNEEEYHTDQVLLHNASVGAGQRQTFRDDLLWYTVGKGVIQEPFLGLEIKAAYDEIASLQAEIARLQVAAPPPQSNLSDVRAQLQIIQAAQEKALKDLSSL